MKRNLVFVLFALVSVVAFSSELECQGGNEYQ